MLHRRSRTYTSRLIVPAHISALWGRKEITRSLRTGDLREARRRAALWEAYAGAFLQEVEKKLRSMKPSEIEGLYQRYLEARFEEIERRLSRPMSEDQNAGTSFYLNDEAHRISGLLAHGEVDERLPLARELAPQADEDAQRVVARRLLEADLQATVAELHALEGRPLVRQPGPAVPPPVPQQAPSPLLSEVIQLYCEERIGLKKWTVRTAEQSRTIYAHVLDLLGDQPIREVTKAHIRNLGAQVLELPTNMAKRFPGLSPREILANAQALEGLQRLAPRSVNKIYQCVRSLFLWAVEHDYLAQSPASILRDVDEGRAQEARKALSDEDVAKFLAYAESKAKEPYQVWVPRIMALTGCRMGEAAQIEKRDIQQVEGIWVFDINADHPEKRVKTGNAIRKIPIHPRLLELGLLEFINSRPDGFLFPRRIRYQDDPKRSPVDLLSKQLSRWLRESGVTDDKKQVQSLRETMATKLKDLGTHDYQIAEILGHENDNISTGRYGKRTQLSVLYDAVCKVALPV